MKQLLLPALCVLLSTAGVAVGCRVYGMPFGEVLIAAAVAAAVSSPVAFGAVLLARPQRRP